MTATATASEGLREDFLAHMANVGRYERQLNELDFTWQTIETIAKMICPQEAKKILPTMTETRAGFGKLEVQLIDNLILETLNKVALDIGSKAQVVVDIVIRNLYERTADVGFLATDDDIRRFILGEPDGPDEGSIVERLKEYRDKYTVYDEIIILDPNGTVLAHLDGDNPIEHSSDSLIQETLGAETYVETFRRTDLRPDLNRALIYSQRIEHPENGAPIGVLCLCFRFDDEMAGIFERLAGNEHAVLLMLDRDGRVIASSDEHHLPLGAQLKTAAGSGQTGIVLFGGREYLAATRSTQGYQGYLGMGWQGHVMVPLTAAFRETARDALAEIDPAMLTALLGNAASFCPALSEIALNADHINRSLRQVVWNGQVMAAGGQGDLSRLKVILQQISETGDRTNRVFNDSIRNLHGTVISSLLADARFIAGLLIDIMDRNLYERANDCRWWALASDLRRILGGGTVDDDARAKIGGILEYINSLYTVYTHLFVYDAQGIVIAASDLHGDGAAAALIGQRADADAVGRVLQLKSTQEYCVSAFEPSGIYGGRPTYVYHAAIRDPEEPWRVVGGIGIVFDAEPEFRNMLRSALPSKEGAFALFADRQGSVIASTDDRIPVGRRFAGIESACALESGEGFSKVVEISGVYYIAGGVMSSGYREYKRSGDYSNDVLAAVFVPLGAGQTVDPALAAAREVQETVFSSPRGRDIREFATFRIGEELYALPAAIVVDSVDSGAISKIQSAKPFLAGLVNVQGNMDEPGGVAAVIDMHYLLSQPKTSEHPQVILVRTQHDIIGMLVDDLHAVPEFDVADVEDLPAMVRNDAGYISGVIRTSTEPPCLMHILDPNRIHQAAQRKSRTRAGGEREAQ